MCIFHPSISRAVNKSLWTGVEGALAAQECFRPKHAYFKAASFFIITEPLELIIKIAIKQFLFLKSSLK